MGQHEYETGREEALWQKGLRLRKVRGTNPWLAFTAKDGHFNLVLQRAVEVGVVLDWKVVLAGVVDSQEH